MDLHRLCGTIHFGLGSKRVDFGFLMSIIIYFSLRNTFEDLLIFVSVITKMSLDSKLEEMHRTFFPANIVRRRHCCCLYYYKMKRLRFFLSDSELLLALITIVSRQWFLSDKSKYESTCPTTISPPHLDDIKMHQGPIEVISGRYPSTPQY